MQKMIPQEKRIKWEEKIRKQRKSGLSMSRWCRDNQIVISVFCYWRDRIFPKTDPGQLIFTELKDPTHHSLAIEYHGFRVCIDKHFDPTLLKQCLSVLKEVK